MFRTQLKYIFLALFSLVFAINPALANTDTVANEGIMLINEKNIAHEEVEKEETDIVETILHHVSDANENHLGTMGHTHHNSSVPTSVTLLSSQTGITVPPPASDEAGKLTSSVATS